MHFRVANSPSFSLCLLPPAFRAPIGPLELVGQTGSRVEPFQHYIQSSHGWVIVTKGVGMSEEVNFHPGSHTKSWVMYASTIITKSLGVKLITDYSFMKARSKPWGLYRTF